MRRMIGVQEVEDIALGAAVLGTGGGGDPYIGKLMATQAIGDHGPVELVSIDEMGDDEWSVAIAMMGAPTVMVEKMPGGGEAEHAFKAVQSYLGKPIKYIYSIEAGGINSTIPIALASQLHMPLLDLDGMGRAFPEIQMVTQNLFGITATPFTMADEKGNSAVLATIDNRWMETFARSIAVNMGATAHIACYAASGAQQREAAVHGTMSLAETIGRSIREARAAHGDPVARDLRAHQGLRDLPREDRGRAAAHGGRLCARRGNHRGHRRGSRAPDEHRVPEREPGGDEGRRHRGERAGPDHDGRRRHRRTDHDRGVALWLPREGDRHAQPPALAHAGSAEGGGTTVFWV